MDTPKIQKRETPNGKQRLLKFLRGLLEDPRNESVIIWVNRQELIFKMVKPHQVASMWGAATGNPKMTYDKMSRALRYLYESETLRKIKGKDSRYQFIETNNHFIPKTPFTIANILNDSIGNNSFASTSSGSPSPPRMRPAPIAQSPMLNPFPQMNVAQMAQSAAQLNTFMAQNPFLQALLTQNLRNIFPTLFPAPNN